MTREEMLDEIRAEIDAESAKAFKHHNWERAKALEWALGIIDKYVTENEPQKNDIEKRKPCTNYEDGCEEWAGCPCVHYKAESEEVIYCPPDGQWIGCN